MKIRENFYSWDDFAYNLTACNYSYIQLIDFNARFYSPTLGRFIQPDSIVPNWTNPQSLNRFSYVQNNPVKYIDPSGHRECTSLECDGADDLPPGDPYATVFPETALDENFLTKKPTKGSNTGLSGEDFYKWYDLLWHDLTGWWWKTFGADGDFSVWDAMAVILIFESHSNYDAVRNGLGEATGRAVHEVCRFVYGYTCQITEQFVNGFVNYMASATGRVLNMQVPDDPYTNKYFDDGNMADYISLSLDLENGLQLWSNGGEGGRSEPFHFRDSTYPGNWKQYLYGMDKYLHFRNEGFFVFSVCAFNAAVEHGMTPAAYGCPVIRP